MCFLRSQGGFVEEDFGGGLRGQRFPDSRPRFDPASQLETHEGETGMDAQGKTTKIKQITFTSMGICKKHFETDFYLPLLLEHPLDHL